LSKSSPDFLHHASKSLFQRLALGHLAQRSQGQQSDSASKERRNRLKPQPDDLMQEFYPAWAARVNQFSLGFAGIGLGTQEDQDGANGNAEAIVKSGVIQETAGGNVRIGSGLKVDIDNLPQGIAEADGYVRGRRQGRQVYVQRDCWPQARQIEGRNE